MFVNSFKFNCCNSNRNECLLYVFCFVDIWSFVILVDYIDFDLIWLLKVGCAFHYKNLQKMEENMAVKPPKWLELLLVKKFFGICHDHKDMRKSEINIYCIECDICMCSHCFAEDLTHRCHRQLQIRRYVYNSVVRISDMQKLIDCSKVQVNC